MQNHTAGSEPPAAVPACLETAVGRAAALTAELLAGPPVPGIHAGLAHQLSGGKGLRPALALWWGERLGVDRAGAESWGLAVELLHNAFLIHDDIEDGDRYRRGRPTLWVEAGVPVALNVADHLIAEAYRRIASIDAPSAAVVAMVGDFASTHRTTVEGQALDLEHRADPHFTLERYEAIIRRKTGRYLALAWVGPARLAGWTDEEVDALWRIGDELGPAFQIRDDVLDLSSAKGRGGEIGCDIREGKPSILVAHALAAPELAAEDRTRLLEILSRDRASTTAADVEWTVEKFDALGSRAFALGEARRRVESARRLFPSLRGSTPERVAEFESIAAFLVDREV